MPRKTHMTPTPDGPKTASPAQYRALRFWAGNTADDPARGADNRPWATRAGLPLHTVQTRTAASLQLNGWWVLHPGRGYVLTDHGRLACGMAPIHRDKPCPSPGCEARPRERCRELGPTGRRYTDHVHDVRVALSPVLRSTLTTVPAAQAAAGTGAVRARTPRRPGETGRRAGGPYRADTGGPRVTARQLAEALDLCSPGYLQRIDHPAEPRHLGLYGGT